MDNLGIGYDYDVRYLTRHDSAVCLLTYLACQLHYYYVIYDVDDDVYVDKREQNDYCLT